VLLNDVQFVEAARVIAQRTLLPENSDAAPASDEQRLRHMWLEIVSRPATEQEMSVLTAALKRERDRYRSKPNQAKLLISVGESPRNRNVDAGEHAAWTQIASTILNLSEIVTRQ
jgi:hypothetical protein